MRLSLSVAGAAAALSFTLAATALSPAANAQYVVVPAPVVVAPAPVVVVRPHYYYRHVHWVPAHFNRFGVFVPGHYY
jgi:hypothetical protein